MFIFLIKIITFVLPKQPPMKYFFYLILLFSSNSFSQETIRIPDVALEESLIDLQIDTNGLNGTILVSDAKYVVNLNIQNPLENKDLPNVHSKIKDLTGIEHFPNLKRLNCQGNEISKMNLSHSTKLTFLNCSQNKLEKLDVSNSPELFFLSCDLNKLTSLKLGNKPKLTELYCNSNQLAELNLKGCTIIDAADFSANPLTEIIINNTTASAIPEGWYKDENTVYTTTSEEKQLNTTTETKTTKSIVEELPKTPVYNEDFKRTVVAEFEKLVLNEEYLQEKKEEIRKKYNLNEEELTNWLAEFSSLLKNKDLKN